MLRRINKGVPSKQPPPNTINLIDGGRRPRTRMPGKHFAQLALAGVIIAIALITLVAFVIMAEVSQRS